MLAHSVGSGPWRPEIDPTQPQWTEQEGFDYEIARDTLWGEIGRRNAALNALAPSDEAERQRLRGERTAFFNLAHDLRLHDARRVAAIRRLDFEEAFRDGPEPRLKF